MKKLLSALLLAFLLFVPKNSFAVTYQLAYGSPYFQEITLNQPGYTIPTIHYLSRKYLVYTSCISGGCHESYQGRNVFLFDGINRIQLTFHPDLDLNIIDVQSPVVNISSVSINNDVVNWFDGVPRSYAIPNYVSPDYIPPSDFIAYVSNGNMYIHPKGTSNYINITQGVTLNGNPVSIGNVNYYKQSGNNLIWRSLNGWFAFYNYDMDAVFLWQYSLYLSVADIDGNTFFYAHQDDASNNINYFTFIPSVIGQAPFAAAGNDINASANQLVTLDGSQSSDPDGNITGYRWSRLPEHAELCSFSSSPTCQFRTLGRAQEVIELEVRDNNNNVATDRMNIFHTMPGVCGNATVEGDEVCDGNAASCVNAQNYSGTHQCNAQCSGFGTCNVTQSCGDNIVNGNEICDGNTQACTTGGYAGTLVCNAQCSGFNSCTTTQYCGDGAVNGAEQCDDGNTTSGDGCSSTCTTEVSQSQYLWKEAEGYSSIVSPMVVQADANASGGQFVVAPNGGPDYTSTGTVMTTYTVNITQAGNYLLWGRALAPNLSDNSFTVQIDSGTNNVWDVDVSASWAWDKVSNRGGADPVQFNLSAGAHTIKIKARETGTKIDKILLTNNLSYIPNGLGL